MCLMCLFVSACVGMQKMWKDEVQPVKGMVCFQECWGQSGECDPCRPRFSLSSSSFTVHPLQPVEDLFIFASLGCCGCTSIYTVLQILSPMFLSHHSLLLLFDFTYSPEPQCVHGHIVISSVTTIPNAVFFHFPTQQFPWETPQ